MTKPVKNDLDTIKQMIGEVFLIKKDDPHTLIKKDQIALLYGVEISRFSPIPPNPQEFFAYLLINEQIDILGCLGTKEFFEFLKPISTF